MKTVEEKAKAYDEFLERYKAKQAYKSKEIHEFIEYLFPELAESEDEKAINAIKKLVYWADGNQQVTSEQYNLIMTWLKKQGGHK